MKKRATALGFLVILISVSATWIYVNYDPPLLRRGVDPAWSRLVDFSLFGVHLNRSLLYQFVGKEVQAKQALAEAIWWRPTYLEWYFGRAFDNLSEVGGGYSRAGCEGIAKKAFLASLGQERETLKCQLAARHFFVRTNDWSSVAKASQNISKIAPNDSLNRYTLGKAYYHLGMVEDAAEQFREALGMEPNLADAYYYLGLVLKKQGRKDGAEKMFLRALQVVPTHIEALRALEQSYMKN
jgi:tetratricopeptide (TPR) repeat protein